MHYRSSLFLFFAAWLAPTAAHAQVFTQQGGKLVGSGAVGPAVQGASVALSADGNTALVGGPYDNDQLGAVWVYTRDSNGNWSQQGSKLVGTGAVGGAYQGSAIALSANGDTALVGGPADNNDIGAVWVFTRDANGIWSQQGSKLIGTGAVGAAYQGGSVALSADGNTALVGGWDDNSQAGAMWVFIRAGNGTWSQQGSKLVGSGAVGFANQGTGAALSADGNTALWGGGTDNGGVGALWVFTRDGNGNWSQQGNKLVGTGAVGAAREGNWTALSAAGNTALEGGDRDNGGVGAAWVFTRDTNGIWSQQGSKLVGSGAVGAARQGWDVAISGDGDTALIGGYADNSGAGAIWVFVRDGSGNWSQQGDKLVSPSLSVALSSDGNTAMVGNPFDNYNIGAAWPYVRALSESLEYVPITPCRVVDTRGADGPLGGPELAAETSRSFPLPSGSCSIPSNAAAYSLNVAVVPNGPLGYLTVWPTGQSRPLVATLNSDGRVKANAAIVPAGSDGSINVFATNATQLIVDIDGYFVPPGTSTLAFYPLTPCRVADTRRADGPLGGPYLQGGTARVFPILSSTCSIPSTATAYSLNFTAVPHGALGYMTVWPTGEAQPLVSTLNASTGTVTANAAIVPVGSSGEISVYPSNDTDLVIDANGYFAPPAFGGLSLYTQTPCRALDTRDSSGEFQGTLAVNVGGSTCGALASAAQAFVLNATVVPGGPLGYLTLWPDGETQPYVATLNASDGAITSNLAIVPTTNGSIDAFASNPTQLILDMFGFFAP